MLLSTVATVVIGFSLWFTAKGPFLAASRSAGTEPKPKADPQEPSQPLIPAGVGRYPPLGITPGTDAGASFGAEPDFDPLSKQTVTQAAIRTPHDLLRILPQGYSVLGAVNVDALRRFSWAADILARRKLPKLRGHLDRLGFDPQEASRVAFGIDLEARAGSSTGKVDTRYLGRLDRPFCLVAAGRIARKPLLRRYRQLGPLAAAMVMGRRVYRRTGDYALSFPVRGVVAWSYRQPMGPLLQLMLEDASRSAVTHQVRKLLEEGGLAFRPPHPMLALAWTPQPGRRVPYPLNRLGGAAVRGAVLLARSRGQVVHGELSLLMSDASTAKRIAKLLRYVRRIVAQHPRVGRNQLKSLVETIPVRVQGRAIRISVELHPWHQRSLMLMLHKLMDTRK